jgi:hypothetical protein
MECDCLKLSLILCLNSFFVPFVVHSSYPLKLIFTLLGAVETELIRSLQRGEQEKLRIGAYPLELVT